MGEEAVQNAITSCVLDTLAIGVIVTDGHANRLYANAAAHRLLSEPAGPLRCCSAGRVFAARHETQNDLRAMISLACAPGGNAATRPANGDAAHGNTADAGPAVAGRSYILVPSLDRVGPDLAICILPVGPPEPERPACHGNGASAMLLVRPIERSCNLEIEAQRLLGLSKAEARLASGLAAGLSLQEAAGSQRISLSTARSHLKSIFRKTGLGRQSQLVALLRSAQMPIETGAPTAITTRARMITGSASAP